MITATEINSPILIVDDEPQNLRLLERVLNRGGFGHVIVTQDSERVQPLADEHRPDLYVIDLNMPGKGGLQLIDGIRADEAWPPVPILVLSGDASVEARRSAIQRGANDFLSKPFDAPEILARIRNLLRSRNLEKEVLDCKNSLEKLVAHRTWQLEQSQLELLRRLSKAAELRDDETGLHVSRVSLFAGALARAAGLDPVKCDLIELATPLHDIGKIGIPDRILLKPAKLDPDEWEVMKSHAELGASILAGSQSEIVRTAEIIALTHHERWDGNGYPRRLAGPQIPIEGRIVAICDVFDALTSERPYKKAWPVEQAVAEIERCAGSQFDPELVACFSSTWPTFLEISRGLRSTVAVA